MLPDVSDDCAANRLIGQFADFGESGLDQLGIRSTDQNDVILANDPARIGCAVTM